PELQEEMKLDDGRICDPCQRSLIIWVRFIVQLTAAKVVLGIEQIHDPELLRQKSSSASDVNKGIKATRIPSSGDIRSLVKMIDLFRNWFSSCPEMSGAKSTKIIDYSDDRISVTPRSIFTLSTRYDSNHLKNLYIGITR
ncbi:Hypothetical predicted protein, partial [Paramuricea clavata]